MGLDSESKRKREKHAVDMTIAPEPDEPRWTPPPPEQCDEDLYEMYLDDRQRERIKVRIVNHDYRTVEFAIVHQTRSGVGWADVAVADSSHNDEVHIHFYGRSTGDRVGKPEHLMEVRSQADVEAGYGLALDRICDDWEHNRRRWNDA